MKKTIKDFLFKRRFKPLKNKKGFSLVEVLVAVGLIAIITAIAVPQFQDYREQTGLVAGNTSVSNIARAYQNCMALNAFANCDSLEDIKIECAECTNATLGTAPPFCANYSNPAGGKAFRMCVSVDANNKVTKTVGGDIKVCHETCAGAGCAHTNTVVTSKIKRCSTANFATECATVKTANTVTPVRTYTLSCPTTTGANSGTCNTSGGTCR